MPRPPTRTFLERKARVEAILPILRRTYPDARCSLDFRNPLELIIATILSAQCTDERVNLVTPRLFRTYKTAAELANAPQEELEKAIQSTGFFRNKARSLRGMAAALVAEHGSRVPETMEALFGLPGVGRKTANVVLGNAFDKNVGVVVDTHVTRVANRLKLTDHASDAVKIEHDLMPLVPKEDWTLFSHLLIHHGRQLCTARNPKCEQCPLLAYCLFGKVTVKARAKTK